MIKSTYGGKAYYFAPKLYSIQSNFYDSIFLEQEADIAISLTPALEASKARIMEIAKLQHIVFLNLDNSGD